MSIFACSLELKCSNLLIIQKLFWETPSVLRRLADARSSRSWRWAASAKRLSAIAVAKRPLRSSSLMSSGTYLETEMATRELWGDISFRTDSASSRDGWDGRSQKQHRNQYVWSRERAFRKLICQLSWLRVIINRLGSFLALIALTWTPFPIWYSLRIAFENEISEWNWPKIIGGLFCVCVARTPKYLPKLNVSYCRLFHNQTISFAAFSRDLQNSKNKKGAINSGLFWFFCYIVNIDTMFRVKNAFSINVSELFWQVCKISGPEPRLPARLGLLDIVVVLPAVHRDVWIRRNTLLQITFVSLLNRTVLHD